MTRPDNACEISRRYRKRPLLSFISAAVLICDLWDGLASGAVIGKGRGRSRQASFYDELRGGGRGGGGGAAGLKGSERERGRPAAAAARRGQSAYQLGLRVSELEIPNYSRGLAAGGGRGRGGGCSRRPTRHKARRAASWWPGVKGWPRLAGCSIARRATGRATCGHARAGPPLWRNNKGYDYSLSRSRSPPPPPLELRAGLRN